MGCHAVLNYKDPNFKKDFRKVGLVDIYFDNGESTIVFSSLVFSCCHKPVCVILTRLVSRRGDIGYGLDEIEPLRPDNRMWCNRHV